MANYNSQYTGQQIDSAVGKANNPDSAPTANSGNLVTSAGVKSAIDAEKTRAQGVEATKAPIDSPAFTGSPTAPTPPAGNSSTRLATTAFVASVKGFGQPEAIPGSSDLNDYEGYGVYYCTTTPSQSVAHNPIPGTPFTMQVMERDPNGVEQVLFGNNGSLYLRTSYNGNWSQWYRITGSPM